MSPHRPCCLPWRGTWCCMWRPRSGTPMVEPIDRKTTHLVGPDFTTEAFIIPVTQTAPSPYCFTVFFSLVFLSPLLRVSALHRYMQRAMALSDVMSLEELVCPLKGNRERISTNIRGLQGVCRVDNSTAGPSGIINACSLLFCCSNYMFLHFP